MNKRHLNPKFNNQNKEPLEIMNKIEY